MGGEELDLGIGAASIPSFNPMSLAARLVPSAQNYYRPDFLVWAIN